MRSRVAVPLLLAVLVLAGAAGMAGCGSAGTPPSPGGDTGSSGGTPDATPSSGGTPGATPTPPVTFGPTAPPRLPSPRHTKPAPGKEIVITGHVEDGVEAGCRVIRTLSGPTYTLLLTPALQRQIELAADPVTLRGRLRPGLMTTCQQGTPFEVSAVVPA
jgi:hypothetical protein